MNLNIVNNEKLKKINTYLLIILLSNIYIKFYFIVKGIHIDSIIISNIKSIIDFNSLIIIPFLIFIYIFKSFKKLIIFVVIYIVVLVLCSPIIIIGNLWLFNDLTINNGLRRISEYPYDNNSQLCEYLEYDEGAFGGGELIFTIDTKIIPGFRKIKFLDTNEYKEEFIYDSIETKRYLNYKNHRFKLNKIESLNIREVKILND